MFYVHKISRPEDKWDLFESQLSEQARWIVANVETKTLLQNKVLENQEALAGDQILRASEYWVKLFTINCPEWQIVSESLIFALIEEWFESKQIPSKYKDIEAFYNFIEQFLPLLSASEADMLTDWVSQDPDRRERLGGWLNYAKEFWTVLVKKKWISRPWSLVILLNRADIFFGDGEQYFFDLGADLKHQEVDFLKALSKHKEVHLLMPETDWTHKYSKTLSVYNKVVESADEIINDKNNSRVNINLKTKSFESVVLEVQQATKKVRQWLDAGVAANHIAITCAEIESYWDLIREYFIIEGIPINKNYVGRAIALPYVQLWLAKLHVNNKNFEQHDLEEIIYNPLVFSSDGIDYSDFKKNFFNIYDFNFIKKTFRIKQSIDETHLVDTITFIDLLYQLWSIEDKKLIDQISDQIIADLRVDHKMSFNLWVKYLELILSRMECLVHAADADGVIISNTINMEWTYTTHFIALGCTQGNLRETIKTPASIYDVLAIERDLGFYLNRPEKDKNEFDLRWILQKNLEDVFLFCSETNFEGAAQVVSSYWLQLDNSYRDSDTNKMLTRWQSIMRSDFDMVSRELNWLQDEKGVIYNKIIADYDATINNLQIEQNYEGRLSATALSTLAKCPFKFYADKILNLDEPRYYDLDIDNLYQGSLLHKIIEVVFITFPSLEISEDQLVDIYEQSLKKYPVRSQLKEFWLNERHRHLKILQSFIQFEKDWRIKNPTIKTISMEGKIRGYLGVNDDLGLNLSTEKISSSWEFTGKIDRVDQDSNGNLAILDYKLSSGSVKSFKNWSANEQFQLVLYALAIERGLGEEIPTNEVVAAAYFFLKETERSAGYIISDADHEFTYSKGKISIQKKDEAFAEIIKEVMSCLDILKNRKFPPLPKREKICEACNWSRLCRAPHLR